MQEIDACLPQTQCTRCGYPRCLAYADALARGEADIDQCPPGGEVTIQALARVLGIPPKPLDGKYGAHLPRARAVIDEARCIGCRKCLDVCPVDAIVGAAKLMHTVIASDCTGCELCLAPCPVDCIAMVVVNVAERAGPWPEYDVRDTERWRAKTARRWQRLAHAKAEADAATASTQRQAHKRARIKTEIAAALARVKAKRAGGAV